MPSFLITSHCEYYGARATTQDEPSFPARFARLLYLHYLKNRYPEVDRNRLSQSSDTPLKSPSFHKNFFDAAVLLSFFLLTISLHTVFMGLWELA